VARKLLEIAASIVKAQASVGKISLEEVEHILMKTFLSLQRIQQAEHQGVALEAGCEMSEVSPVYRNVLQSAAPKESIRENRIMCLECGMEMKQLTRKHLAIHDLNPKEYKRKWGLPMRTPLSAKSLSRARSKAAKNRGLPENLMKFLQERRRKSAEETISSPSNRT